MAFLAATIKDIAGVTTTLLSVGALMATPERIVRYTSPKSLFASQSEEKKDGVNEDLTPDYMNVLGMIFSMCALMLR